MLPEYFEFSVPTKIVYGIGIIGNIADNVKQFGKRRAILVTGPNVSKAGPGDKVKAGFAQTDIEIVCVFDQVPNDSNVKCVAACAAMARENNCDFMIVLGGGSVMDTAKVANIMICKGGKIEDHMGAYLLGNDKLLPMILIPTTAGTGSEVTKVAVIADPDNNVKLPFAETQFLPDMAILDPEMTVSMPPKLTAATGMDAMTHAIEAFVDKEWSPASDALAKQAIKLINENILTAVANPKDLKARGAMLVASTLAGIAFSHSMVGMVHGISHALGGVYHIPHGLANALVLPEVMEYNLESRLERYAEIAEIMGFEAAKPIATMKSVSRTKMGVKFWQSFAQVDTWLLRRQAQSGIDHIRELNRHLAHLSGMPLNLKDAGIKDELARIDLVVTNAMQDGSMIYNPREVEAEAVRKIVEKLYHDDSKPEEISLDQIQAEATSGKKELKNIFKDTEMLYDVLGGFYESLKADPNLGGPLKDSGLLVQFVYMNPSGVITIDAKNEGLNIYIGDAFKGEPEVTMTMNADFAHYFWHGKVNLVSALTRRQVVAKGNVPKTLKLLPILKPAYDLYPKFLESKNLSDLVVK